MNIQIRMLRTLLDQMRADLERPHRFAFERVGFVSSRIGNSGNDPLLVLLDGYAPVNDVDYIPDEFCGARINGTAIRGAMQQVLTSGQGVFHVHMHSRLGRPGLSRTDAVELPKVIRSFHAVGPQQAHGILLLSPDHCRAWIHAPKQDQMIEAARVNIVGFPMGFFA